MSALDNLPEVMAKVCYDFEAPGWPGVRIKGSSEIRELSFARQIVEKLNAEYGEGSHWVEPLNWTYDEHIASLMSATDDALRARDGESR